jgi:restriction system protein
VTSIDSKIILIDGEHLAQLMIDNDTGVSKYASCDIEKIDADCFIEE